jgi:hypothetical protein
MLSQHIKQEQLHACKCLNLSISLSVDDIATIDADEHNIRDVIKQTCRQNDITRLKLGTSPNGIHSVTFAFFIFQRYF